MSHQRTQEVEEIIARARKARADGLKALQDDVHDWAKSKGWADTQLTIEDTDAVLGKLALIHSEVSEAVEEVRVGRLSDYEDKSIFHDNENALGDMLYVKKPVGLVSELADIVIRCFQLAGHMDIDLGAAIVEKMAFNTTRPYRHGGKRA